MMNVVIGAMINIGEKEMTIYEKILKYREILEFLQEELEYLEHDYNFKISEIKEAWDDEQEKDSVDWMNMPTTEQIFNRRVIDNGDRFHHFDKCGCKRSRRVAKFSTNYTNAEIASKRQANLDRIAQWAILDGVKQDVIDDFIIKYDLSSEEIERFEDVMSETYHNIIPGGMNTYDDRWYAVYSNIFNLSILSKRP